MSDTLTKMHYKTYKPNGQTNMDDYDIWNNLTYLTPMFFIIGVGFFGF